MAPKLSQAQTRGLFDFLSSHQKISSVLTWKAACLRAEELKLDVKSFKQMRGEKVVPKRLGNLHKGLNSDIEPFTEIEDRAISTLIKETATRKETAFTRVKELWSNIVRDLRPLQDTRPNILDDLKAYCNGKITQAAKVKQTEIDRNLKFLISRSRWNKAVRPGEVVDMSGNRISKTEKELLSLGIKFSTGTNDRTALDVATAVNKFLYRHKNDPKVPDISFIRASVIPHLATQRHATLPDRYLKAIRSLTAKKGITIIPADKGGFCCILRTTKYHALGLDVLSDQTTFAPVLDGDIEGSDIAAMQKSYNSQIDAIAERTRDGDLATTIGKLISPRCPKFPTMNGNLKVHKDPVTLRPVISHVNAPMSRGSKWAAQQLSACVGLISKAHVKDTRDFYEKVRHCKAKGRLLSLDVTSLFTNIPVNEVIEVVRDHSTGTNPTFILPDPEIFCDILKVCISFNQFCFDSKYYRQITGLPMGSSLSPVLANIFMEHFETYLLEDIPVDLRPTFWLRYVDDIMCCYKDITKLESFLTLLNQIRPTIKFTVELSVISNDGTTLPSDVSESIPFLELNVMRSTDGNFSFSIYRKPCHSGNYLHAYSYQPLFQKTSVIRNLYLRAYRYCDTQFLPQEESRI